MRPAPGGSFFGSKRQDLIERAEIANRSQADIFVSIHCNSFPQSIWSGAQTFYYPGREESRILAVAIQTELVRRLGPNRRQANTGDYRVLKEAKMPAVVVEAGFLSNPQEGRLLADADYQKRVADAIFWGESSGTSRCWRQGPRGLAGRSRSEGWSKPSFRYRRLRLTPVAEG